MRPMDATLGGYPWLPAGNARGGAGVSTGMSLLILAIASVLTTAPCILLSAFDGPGVHPRPG